MAKETPESIIRGFLDYATGLRKGLMHEDGAGWVSHEQIDQMISRYVGRLTNHHYNAAGGQRYIDGHGWVNHCRVCDEPEGQGAHFHNPKRS